MAKDPTKVRAEKRLFLRATATLDPDGFRHWVFPEVACDVVEDGFARMTVTHFINGRTWEVVETPSGVRHSTLKARDARGSLHCRALRRIEEDHLMKFAIRD